LKRPRGPPGLRLHRAGNGRYPRKRCIRRRWQSAPIQARRRPVHAEAEPEYEEAVEEETCAAAAPGARPAARHRTFADRQKQIATQQGRIENIAEHAMRKKKGLFGVSPAPASAADDPARAPKEPVMNVRAPPGPGVARQSRAPNRRRRSIPVSTTTSSKLAFLRRAN
jgi:hypothetical protein